MSKKDKKPEAAQAQAEAQEPVQVQPEEAPETGAPQENTQAPETEQSPLVAEVESLKSQMAQQEDKYLRLAAEYDNYRRRTAKEKESIWSEAKADAAVAFLPVYDNLERALKQDTADEAYKKGVEMTMQGFESILEALNVKAFGAAGEPFNPAFHNAVMHVDDEALGENIIAEVFQTGFQMGEKVIRHAMVKVAN